MSALVVYHTNQQSSDDLSIDSLQNKVPERGAADDDVPSVSDAQPLNIPPASKRKIASSEDGAHSSPTQISRDKNPHPQKKQDMERAPVNAGAAAVPARKAEQGSIAPKPSTRKETLSVGKPAKPLGRTRSAQMREKVFGASDEELSEVDNEDDLPPAAPPVSRLEATTKENPRIPTKDAAMERKQPSSAKTRSGAVRRVLDSDDEETGQRSSVLTVASGVRSTANKKKRVIPVTPDISDEDIPEPPERSFVTPPRSQVNSVVAPVTPTKPPAGKAPTLQEPCSPALGVTGVAESPDAEATLPKNHERTLSRPLAPSAECTANSPVAAASVDASRITARKVTPQSRGAVSPDAETSKAHNVLADCAAKTDTEHAPKPRTKPKLPTQVKPIPLDLELSDHGTLSSSAVAASAEVSQS